jgi:tetratricopeptide (TPR) repeat protein
MRAPITLFLVCLLGLSGIPQRAAAHADDEIPPVAQAAQAHLKQGRYAEALAAAEAWAAEAPADSRAYSLATTSAIFAREKVRALAYARKSVELSPAAIAPRASLLLALQLSGKASEKEVARAELYELWRKTDATAQRPASFRRDDFDHEGKKIVATEFFELQGPRALKYEFFVFDAAGGPIAYRISFGASEKDGGRSYHLDRYYPDNSHEALGSFKSELPYDQVKALTTAVVSGKRKPVSAMPAR